MIFALDPTILGFIIFICLILIFILIMQIIKAIKKSYKNKKMYFDIFEILNKIIEDRKIKDYATLKISEVKAYDFYLETRTHIYYIKAVPNHKNDEICVNNKVKWQINASLSLEKIKYVDNISGLMNLDVDFPTKKIVKKLYIIYPNAKTLLKYINECELAFIYPDTDVYGVNLITYQTLVEHPEHIEAK